MILDRYITKEILPNIFLGLLVFTFVMLMNQILVLAEILITRNVEFLKIFLIIFYTLPALTVLTVPMSLLLGVLLGLGRLSGDSELTVMRASGVSPYRLVVPILSVAFACWLLCSYLIQVSVPWGNYALSRLMFQILTTNATSDLKPRIFHNQFPNMVLYVQDIPSKGDIWKGILIYDETRVDKARLVLAKYGIVRRKSESNQLELELQNGSWHEVDPLNARDYTFANFFQNVLPLPMPPQFFSGEIPKGDREQTIPELKESIRQFQAKKLPTKFLEVEIQKKYSIPFACVIFAFLAQALGFASKKSSRSSAYAISIGIILIYYIFLIGGERLGDAGKISPWLAAWAGNISLGVLGLVLVVQTNTNALSKGFKQLRLGARNAQIVSPASDKRRKQIRVRIRVRRFSWHIFTLLDKYIIQEFFKYFILILIALVLIAELIEGTQLVDDLFRNKVGGGVLLQYLKFHFPQWIFYVLPVTALTTTLVTLGSFTKNSEIIAMKSSGISLYRISLPIIIVATILSLFAFWLQDYILPYTNKIAHNYHRAIKGAPPETYSTFERHWISSPDGFYNYDLYDVRKNIMYGFSIYYLDQNNFTLQKRIYARKAVVKNNQWHLNQGWQRVFGPEGAKYEAFQEFKIRLPVSLEYFKTEQELPSEMTFAGLNRYIQKMKARGFDIVRFAVDLQAKLSFPTVSLILTLIAIPFSFTTGKRGALYGIGLSIVMGIVFWFFLALTKSLGYLEILDPFLAAWTPNILATLMALYLLFKLRT